MLASAIVCNLSAQGGAKFRSGIKRAKKAKPTPRTINLTPSAFTTTQGEHQQILAARRLVPALTALIALFPGDCSQRTTDYHHRDESQDTRAERSRRSGRLQACPRISLADAHAAALRAAS